MNPCKYRFATLSLLLLLILSGLQPTPAKGSEASFPEHMLVRVLSSRTLQLEFEFSPFEETRDVFSLTTGDVNADGKDEIIVGSAPGYPPRVRVFGENGTLISEFLAYDESFTGGVFLATCDLDHNGRDEIITGAGFGGRSHVMMYDQWGVPFLSNGFFAFEETSTGGVRVACGDVDGNRLNEIIVSTGKRTAPHIKIFTRTGTFTGKAFSPLGFDEYQGVDIAEVRVPDANKDSIIVSGGYNNSPWVRIYDENGVELASWLAYHQAFHGGVNIARTLLADSTHGILTGAGALGGAHIRLFDTKGNVRENFFPFDERFRGGVDVASGDIDGDGEQEYIVKPAGFPVREDVQGKYIDVDLSEQTLTAYENGYFIDRFRISSGKAGFPTPQGRFTIIRKRPLVTLSWYYGANNPHNYDLPDVPWVMTFYGPYTIHGTYWHSNFGTPMSHGCVNMYTPDSAWIYSWASVGTLVISHE